MAEMRRFLSTSGSIVVAIGVCVLATGLLLTFPRDPLVWQALTWVLVAALLGLAVLVLASGWVLATNPAARTWRRIVPFGVGLACLLAVAAAWF